MINATSGISCTKNVRFTSGISAISGIKATLPESYQAYYPFSSDFIDQVSGDYLAWLDNAPSFGGGGINTVANTNLKVTTYQDNGKGVLLDEGDKGVIAKIGDFTSASYTGGVADSGTQMTFSATTVAGKYSGQVVAAFINTVVTVKATGSRVRITNNVSAGTFDVILINGDVTDFRAPAELTFDFSPSNYNGDEVAVAALRTASGFGGDDVTGVPAAVQWDTSGDFRFGYIGIGKTVADVTAQVMLQTGNMGISTGIGITFAEIGASISSLAVTSDTIVGECFIKYVGGMLSIVIDGVESTPVASVAPTIGTFAQGGANTSNLSSAPGTYGGLLFEVL